MHGLRANAPVNTPVLTLPSDCRSSSLFRAANSRYLRTASDGDTSVPKMPRQLAGTSAASSVNNESGHSVGTIASTSGCSGASTM